MDQLSNMYYGNSVPTDHKNMARFAVPCVKSNIFGSFKVLGGENCAAEVVNVFMQNLSQQQQQQSQQITKVQKLDPSLEPAKLRSNGNGFGFVDQMNNGFGGVHPSTIKTESDSNESSNQSDGRSTMNGISIDNTSLAHFSNFRLNGLNHQSPIDQPNAGPLKSLDSSACIGMNSLLDTLNGSGQNSLANLNNLNHLNNFNLSNFSYLNNGGLIGGNAINNNAISNNAMNTKVPENSGKRTGSGRKPINSKEAELSPEEESKRRQRRERNKEAAARCRKRRVEQTKTLEEETSDLQKQKEMLSKEIVYLQNESDKLMHLLSVHDCKLSLKDN